MIQKPDNKSEEALKINSISSLFQGLSQSDGRNNEAVMMLVLRDWISRVITFDSVSGRALDSSLDHFLSKVSTSKHEPILQGEVQDRLFRIVSHTNNAISAIMGHIRDKVLREHAMQPIHAAIEVDNKSVQWLSRQPGRNLREKLSGKPYLLAVKRRTSIDTSENSLLKAFLLRLEQFLIERQNALPSVTDDSCEELVVVIQRWLRAEETSEISAWRNSPPNNALLQDKRYKKVWDGWLWLQQIDENIFRDNKRLNKDILNMMYWNTLSLFNQTGYLRVVQQPLNLNYDDFSIAPVLPIAGYLFPPKSSSLVGKIKSIDVERKFGFLKTEKGKDLFFHQSDLAKELNIESLRIEDNVNFSIGKNNQGECATDIKLAQLELPEKVEACFLDDRFEINVGEKQFAIGVYDNQIVLIHKDSKASQKIEINAHTLQTIPQKILSLAVNNSDTTRCCEHLTVLPEKMKSSVLDISSIRPAYTNSDGLQQRLPFRLLQQKWKLKNSEKTLDCGNSKAIKTDSDIENISMNSLFGKKTSLSNAERHNSAMFFINKIGTYIEAEQLTYLTPDWVHDFELSFIRKSVNFFFNNSTPLPKSIASIFSWQSSEQFLQSNVQESDLVMIIDSFDNGISITPVQAKYQKELEALIPQTNGITWERHPTTIIKLKQINKNLISYFESDGLPEPEKIIQVFGVDGLKTDAGQLSFVSEKHWYHLAQDIKNAIAQNKIRLNENDVKNCLKSLHVGSSKDSRVFILPSNDLVDCSRIKKSFNLLVGDRSLVEGGSVLDDWQNKIAKLGGDIYLWRDHLPELSIKIVRDGRFENFYLVKNATVTPDRGTTVNIPVSELFTLPAGQYHYSFPLHQGDGDNELQFVAHLKSPSFPLQEASTCKLKMTYSYGSDTPYELKFIPLDSTKAGFNSVQVEWRQTSEVDKLDLENLPIPDFPEQKSWADFQKFPKQDGSGYFDLLEWLERDIKKIKDIALYGYVSGEVSKWIDKGGDNVFCFIEDTFIHKSSGALKRLIESPKPGSVLSFYKIKNNTGKFSAENLIVGTEPPKKCFLSKSIRFPVLTVWSHGHNLSEPDIPDNFRNTVLEGVKTSVSILESKGMPESLKDELFFFLSCLHRDAPNTVISHLIDSVKDKNDFRKYHRNIAYAIGDAELSWQLELLKNVINPTDDGGLTRAIAMEVLSIALWRSKGLIHNLTERDVRSLSLNLYDILEFDLQKIIKEGKGSQVASLSKHLELLLALLRSRHNEDEKFKSILSPDKELTQNYVTLIDDLLRTIDDKEIELKSRINLQIDKPEILINTPDILYALRMYLTADSGANTIVITGVSDEGS